MYIYCFTLIILPKSDSCKGFYQWQCCQITRCWVLGVYFTTEKKQTNKLHLASGPVSMLGTSKSNWLGKEVINMEADCFLLRCLLNNVSFYFSFLRPFISLLHNEGLYDSWPPFILLCPTNLMLLFSYLRQLQKRVIQPPKNCWICYKIEHPVVFPSHHKCLPVFQCLSFSGTRLQDKHFWESQDTDIYMKFINMSTGL